MKVNTHIFSIFQDLSYKEKHWHESCFKCSKCKTSLVDKQFGSKADRIYCGSCYDAQFAARCVVCNDVFKAGMKKMEYKTRQWHEKCFVCCVCKNTIGTKSFIPKENDIYCTGCYEDKFATKCIKCNKVNKQIKTFQTPQKYLGNHQRRRHLPWRSLPSRMFHLHQLHQNFSGPKIHLQR